MWLVWQPLHLILRGWTSSYMRTRNRFWVCWPGLHYGLLVACSLKPLDQRKATVTRAVVIGVSSGSLERVFQYQLMLQSSITSSLTQYGLVMTGWPRFLRSAPSSESLNPTSRRLPCVQLSSCDDQVRYLFILSSTESILRPVCEDAA